MIKRFFSAALLMWALLANAQRATNTLLTQDFWKAKPTVEQVKAEVQKGNSPSARNAMMMDVVTLAINADANLDVIAYLIEQEGNNLDKQTHHYRTYLHWAAMKGNTEVVNLLLSKGANVAARDEHGNTPLSYAVSNGMVQLPVIEALVKGGSDVQMRNADGANLLLQGIAWDKDFSLTNYLVSKGLSLTDVDANGATAFDYAARVGNVPFLKLLLAKGVMPSDKALPMAAAGTRRSANKWEVYQYLIEELKQNPLVVNKEGNTLLHLIASKPNQVEIAYRLMHYGIDANKKNNDGFTAMALAAGARDTEMLKFLLPKTTEVDNANTKGETALTQAVKAGNATAVELLLQSGAKATVKDVTGYNLAYYLVQNYREPHAPTAGSKAGDVQDDFTRIISLLQQNGLDVAKPQTDGSTMYHYVANRQSLGLLKKIANLGIDINAYNHEGMTALHKAAMVAKDDKVLRELLAQGADKTLRTELDETAYDLAAENEYLKRNKVDITFLK